MKSKSKLMNHSWMSDALSNLTHLAGDCGKEKYGESIYDDATYAEKYDD